MTITHTLEKKKKQIVIRESEIIEVRIRARVKGKWKEGWYEAPLSSPERTAKIRFDDGTVPLPSDLPSRIIKSKPHPKKEK